jgi:hypothetical protein
MLFAKIALGFCGTIALAGAYTFHEGVMRVDEDHANGRHLHVWIPAAIVPMALHVIPQRQLGHVAADVRPWLPLFHELTKQLKKYPEAQLVEVLDAHQHVNIRTHQGKLLIDVTEPDGSVHVTCPLAMIEDVSEELAAKTPAA